MHSPISRRKLLKTAGSAAIASSLRELRPLQGAPPDQRESSPPHDPVPNIALEINGKLAAAAFDETGMGRIRQLGVNHVIMGGPEIPWETGQIRAIADRLKAAGLTLGNIMIHGFPNVVYGRPGRDAEIAKIQQSIESAGAAGVPVVEYNFYAHRLIEGYFEKPGRAGAGMTAFDFSRVKDLPPLPEEGGHTSEEMWDNITYFLKAVIPVAERSGVRLARHPNDPPAPISRGSQQIMGDLKGWKRLVEIVPSKSNGITFDCGVTRELGEDPVEVCRYFGSRNRINHVHFRNVHVEIPRENYEEVFLDEGQVDMFTVLKELIRQKYSRLIYPEHPRRLDADKDFAGIPPFYPGGGSYIGYAFNVGYTRAMLQAALEA